MYVIFDLDANNTIVSYKKLNDNPDFSKSKDPEASKKAYDNIKKRAIELSNEEIDSIKCGQTRLINGELKDGIDKVAIVSELKAIQEWFRANDWKVNKLALSEWDSTDPRAQEYIADRRHYRQRQDELLAQLNN